MFISDAAFQFVYPSSFSDSVPAGSLGFGALSDGFYVKDSGGVSSRVLLVKDRRDDVRATGSTDSSLVTEAGIRAAIQAYKPIPDGNNQGQIPYWGTSSWLVSQYMRNVGEVDMLGRLELSTAWIEGGYKAPETPESPHTRWGLQPEIAETNIEMIFYDQDSPINALVNFSIGSVTHNHDYIQAIWDENTNQVSLFLPTLASDGFLKTDSYGMLGVDSSTYEVSLGNPASNGQVLASTTTGTRSWVTLPAAGVNVTNQGDNRIVTSTATTDTLTAESDFLYYDSTAYALLRGEKTATFSIQTSVSNAFDYALLSLVRSRGTMSAPTSVVDGDIIGTIAFQGITTSYGTSSPVTITAYAEDTFAFAARGGSLKIATVPEGSVTSATRFEITKVGAIKFNNAYTFPTSDGTANYILKTNGSGVVSWAAVTSGTVTSVAMTVPTGLTIGGTPITTSGTLALTFTSGYSIPTTANQTNWGTAYTHSQATTGSVHGSTTVGGAILRLGNPGAITFIKIAADNSVSAESAATHLTSLGASTVGGNLFTSTNPSAITFLRVNANNSISYLSSSAFLTAIGVGVGVGTVAGQLPYWDHLNSTWAAINSTKLIWDNTNFRLGVGVSPISTLQVAGTIGVDNGDNTALIVGESGSTTGFKRLLVGINKASSIISFQGECIGTAYIPITFNPTGGSVLIGTSTEVGKLTVSVPSGAGQVGFYLDQLSTTAGLADFRKSGTSLVSINNAGTIVSSIATGTAPFSITSTTLSTNLNADLLDGNHASAFQTVLTNPVTGTGTTGTLPKFSGASSLADSLFTDNGSYGYISTGLGIGTSAAPTATVLLALNSTTGACAAVVKSDYALQTGTGNQTISQLDLRHIATTTAYSRILLRYNMDTTHYEHAQIFAAPGTGGTQQVRNYMVIDGYSGALQIQSGITTYEFANSSHTGLSTNASSYTGIGTLSPATKLHVIGSSTTLAMATLENADTTVGRIFLDLKTAYTANTGDYFRFAMRGDSATVIQTVYDASAAAYVQMSNFLYLTKFFHFGPNNNISFNLATAGASKIGINVMAPVHDLSIGLGANRTIGVIRETTAATAGRSLTVSAGSAVSGGTNLAGGNIILETGVSTGSNATTSFIIRVPKVGSSGTADNALFDVMALSSDGFMALQSEVNFGPQVNLTSYNTTAVNAGYLNFIRSRGTISGGHADISAGDTLGTLTFKGRINSTTAQIASIIVSCPTTSGSYGNGKMLFIAKDTANASHEFFFDHTGFITLSDTSCGINFNTDVNLYRLSANNLKTDDVFTASGIISDNDVVAGIAGALYIGARNSTGSWQFTISGANLIISKHNGSSYVVKQTVNG